MPLKKFAIYGAGIVAASIYTAIKTLYGKQPAYFLVTDATTDKQDENPKEIDSIPVVRLSEWQTKLQEIDVKKEDLKYIIAAPEIHHKTIEKSLYEYGIEEEAMVFVTNEFENQIMARYYQETQPETDLHRVLLKSNNGDKQNQRNNTIQIFQAKCHVDKSLAMEEKVPDYVVPIQVGTVFADKKIAEVQDNVGDNISSKNRNYCELTASYYAWKNCRADYKGLCHYRRIFDITDAQMQELCSENEEWDVILPYPSIHYPDISAQHFRYINDSDWQVLMQILEETTPDYFEAYQEAVTNGEQYFWNYNMLIAKRGIFDDYCEFMFRVLHKVEEFTTPKGDKRADRFAGYMGENLTTIYFLKNKEHLKIFYAGKKWLI